MATVRRHKLRLGRPFPKRHSGLGPIPCNAQSLGGCPLGYRSSLGASNDGDRWEFFESGERYPFEQIERYAERRKRDRFTRAMLRDYLRHFGIELMTDEFLRVDATTQAIRLQRVTKVWHTPEFTLEQVVAGVPWQRRS